jgi:hypothetical protein
MNNFTTWSLVLQRSLIRCFLFFFWNQVQYHFTHIHQEGYEWSDIKLGSKKKKRGSKNLCSTRDQVAKLFTGRKFLTSACKALTFNLHQSNTLQKCNGHCALYNIYYLFHIVCHIWLHILEGVGGNPTHICPNHFTIWEFRENSIGLLVYWIAALLLGICYIQKMSIPLNFHILINYWLY